MAINRNFPNYTKPSKEKKYLHVSAKLIEVSDPQNKLKIIHTIVDKGVTYVKDKHV